MEETLLPPPPPFLRAGMPPPRRAPQGALELHRPQLWALAASLASTGAGSGADCMGSRNGAGSGEDSDSSRNGADPATSGAL